jgi:DNA-binding Lrp family transcriptional regulator
MDNFGKSNVGGDAEKPISFEDTSSLGVSHAPLNMGGAGTAKAPAGPAAPSVKPAVKAPTGKGVSSSDRVSGVKTFFAKLHPGAINFLDEQITNWLKENPGITIKRTNTVTGEIQGKQSEPNIIITIWY